MVDKVAQTKDTGATENDALTDGFRIVIDALRLNEINTIYNVPGIPILSATSAIS